MINKATVKYIQSLQHKKCRDETGCFIAEGPKVVLELLAQNIFECEAIYCTKIGATMLINISAAFINIIEDYELEKISALATANHLLAIFTKKTLPTTYNLKHKITLVLDGIQDPGNLGTIIRTADWFAVQNIFCSHITADCYAPKVVQSTMASLGRVNMYYDDVPTMLKNNATIKKYAADLNGKDVATIEKISEGIIIIGNESKGVSTEVLALADEIITIKKYGAAESLNAAVATGIVLFSITK